MKVTLLVRASKKPEKRVVVERDVVIGRGKDCNLRVLSNDVSRRHCQLVIRESEVAVRDFGSGNGTFINSQKIEPDVDTPLISGDILRIGPLVIKVEFESASTPPDTLEPVVQSAAGNSSSVEAATSQKETSVPEVAAELIADEPDAEPFLEPASDELLPDDDPAVIEVADNASFEEETVVFDQGNAFTPDEKEPELLAVDDEGLADESDYLDEEVEDSPVDLGFADFLNNVNQPPK